MPIVRPEGRTAHKDGRAARPGCLERRRERAGVTRNVEGVVDSAAHNGVDLIAQIPGEDRMRRAEAPGQLQLVRHHIGGDDRRRAREPGTLDNIQTDTAAADHPAH